MTSVIEPVGGYHWDTVTAWCDTHQRECAFRALEWGSFPTKRAARQWQRDAGPGQRRKVIGTTGWDLSSQHAKEVERPCD